jgi:tRNA-specific 2-thiouridylase
VTPPRVAVGLSGGVDSAVAAALLKRAGFDVIAVTMRLWDGRPLPAESGRHTCYGPGESQDIEDAARISEVLGVPFHVVDLAAAFDERILRPCARAYLSGTTPNPCVLCNAVVKFELIPARLRQLGVEVDRFATGHYARVEHDASRSRYLLRKGRDAAKDQSYFLYRLTQEQLATAELPLGARTKAEVRRLAGELALPVSAKKESQDFVSGSYQQIFADRAPPGPIVDERGRVLGEHRGIHLYTIGQRRRLGVAHREPLYVTEIDRRRNALVVGPAEKLYRDELQATGVNWIAVDKIEAPLRVKARIRYRHEESAAILHPLDADRVRVRFDEPQRAITPGQSVVFYDDDVVVGGGIIEL